MSSSGHIDYGFEGKMMGGGGGGYAIGPDGKLAWGAGGSGWGAAGFGPMSGLTPECIRQMRETPTPTSARRLLSEVEKEHLLAIFKEEFERREASFFDEGTERLPYWECKHQEWTFSAPADGESVDLYKFFRRIVRNRMPFMNELERLGIYEPVLSVDEELKYTLRVEIVRWSPWRAYVYESLTTIKALLRDSL